jgi:hypothetical protein
MGMAGQNVLSCEETWLARWARQPSIDMSQILFRNLGCRKPLSVIGVPNLVRCWLFLFPMNPTRVRYSVPCVRVDRPTVRISRAEHLDPRHNLNCAEEYSQITNGTKNAS